MSVTKKSMWKSYQFPMILLLSIALGSIIGLVFGEKAMVLQPFGTVFLNLMFTVVVPLVFVTISSAVGSMVNMKRLGKILGSMFATFIGTGLIASLLVIPVASRTGGHACAGRRCRAASHAIVSALTVGDFSGLLSKSNMLPLVVFSILFVGGKDWLQRKLDD